MMLKFIAPVLMGAALITSPASAQTAAEKAQGGIGGYLAILAIGKLCNFELNKSTTEVVVGNISALQKTSKLSDADIDQAMAGLIDSFKKRKDSPCAGGGKDFDLMTAAMAKSAENEAAGSGVALKALPVRTATSAEPPAAKDPKEAAKNMVIAAHMIEAVADECKIKMSDKESLDLDRVQYYLRGKADLTAAEVKEIVAVVEKQAEESRRQVCAPEWGFRSTLDTLLATIK
jgi:hypothetical protein